MDRMLQIEGLTKQFSSFTAVDNISFSVNRGEVLGFLGPNGAGKTTAMRMVSGFLTPTSGTAYVGGYDVTTAPLEVKRRIGYLPEGAPLYEDMTPVNTFRIIFNKFFNTELELLPDRMYFQFDETKQFSDVTELIKTP